MKKALAMKCTQEQFDAIKDKLVGCEIINIFNFISCGYLVNNYNYKGFSCVSNSVGQFSFEYGREVYETWNEETFLNACGIETERIFKGSELQFWGNVSEQWIDLDSQTSINKYRIKPDNTLKKQELEIQILELQNQLKNL